MEKLLQLEAKRKQLITRLVVGIILGVVVGIFLAVSIHPIAGLVGFGFVSFFAYLILVLKGHLAFTKDFKQYVVVPTLSELYDNLEFRHKEGLDKNIVYNTGLVAKGNTYKSNDYMRASYKGIGFVCADVDVENVTSNGKSTTTVTYFKGKWMIFDFAAAYNKYLSIREKQFFGSTTSGRSLFNIFSDLPNTKKVKFESIKFNEEFEVFSSDEQFAFYIVTPVFMESLKMLKEAIDGQLTVGFINGKLHIAVDSRNDQFEHSIFVPITQAVHDKIKEEASVITTFVDALLVDNYKREVK